MPKLDWERLWGVRSALPAPTSLPSPEQLGEAALGQAQGKSQGPPSSDKGNLERKGKVVKRGAKGHKGKKKPSPLPNKTEDQDCLGGRSHRAFSNLEPARIALTASTPWNKLIPDVIEIGEVSQ